MKKYLILVLIVLLIGALMVGCTTVTPEIDLSRKPAAGQPAQKATGSVIIEKKDDPDEWTRSCSFNAHEETDKHDAKGKLVWLQTNTDGLSIKIEVDIDEVDVINNEAWFSGLATSSVRNGERLYVHVTDIATPGYMADVFELQWGDGETFFYNVLDGNLVVHHRLPPTISSEDLAGSFLVGEFYEFDVKTVNPKYGFDYEHVLFNYTIFGIAPSNIVSFKYYDEGTATWYDAPVIQDGSNVIGFFGPPTGFPMGVPYNESTTFEIKIDTMGTYPVTITLNDLDDGNAVLAILTEDVVVFSETLEIGDSYGGGIVAYILQGGDPGYDPNVQHGLIAAAADQSTGAWITGDDTQTTWVNGVSYGGTSTDYGTGQANTNAMKAQTGYTGGAAKVCDDYSVTVGSVTYNDWFLPSKDELNKLYINKVVIDGFADYIYWGSSEYLASFAWAQGFYGGVQGSGYKGNVYRVRAVRAF